MNGINESTEGTTVIPIFCEISDAKFGYLSLDPLEQAVLRGILRVAIIEHRDGDGVMEDERPNQPQDQLQGAVYDVRAV